MVLIHKNMTQAYFLPLEMSTDTQREATYERAAAMITNW